MSGLCVLRDIAREILPSPMDLEALKRGLLRNIAEDPDMEVVRVIEESVSNDTGQTLNSSLLAECPFCGHPDPCIQASSMGDCSAEARTVCPVCHVVTTRSCQPWCIVCTLTGKDITRPLAIGRAIAICNTRTKREEMKGADYRRAM